MLSSRKGTAPTLVGAFDSVRINLLKERQEEAQRLRPQGKRSKAIREPRDLISKLKAMEKVKEPNFLDEVMRKVEDIIFQNRENPDRLRTELLEFLPEKIKQSFRNGVEAGSRKTGQVRQNKKPYRQFRR